MLVAGDKCLVDTANYSIQLDGYSIVACSVSGREITLAHYGIEEKAYFTFKDLTEKAQMGHSFYKLPSSTFRYTR